MLISEYIEKTGANVINLSADKEITSAYAGDFLSFVMGNAKEGSIWFTVMNNVNVAGVAYLAGCACVVLCEGVCADKSLAEKCAKQGINLLGTKSTVYEACAMYSRL